jgi:tape measure domain-containing protein
MATVGLAYEITAKDRKLLEAFKRSGQALGQFTQQVENDGNAIDKVYNKIAKTVGGVFAIGTLKNFAQQIIHVRGEVQQLESAFETMLGSKAKSDAMMKDIVNLAQATPFTLTEVADNTKQLIAMGIASDKAIGTVKALGDVAAGVSVPMSRLAVNYGQVAAPGKMQTKEMKDFAMAGVPIVAELAKMLGKTAAEINAMAEAGEIGFPIVEEAFKRMSSEGGMFYNMMEKQNASMTGQISKLQDAFEGVLNEIGKSGEGVFASAIGGMTMLIANYEKIGKILMGLVATDRKSVV